MRVRILPAAVAALAILGVTTLPATQAQTIGACGLPQAAFCETFDQPNPNGAGTRSGDLNGVLWGASRSSQNNNGSSASDYWAASNESICGSSTPVAPERDIRVCNGQLVETVNDNGLVAVLGMYPRQPFDIANRTGTVTFDVSNDTQGPHAAWPTFVYTDQPVPAPHGESLPGVQNQPRNSFGVSFDTPNCNGDMSMTGVSNMWITVNYVLTELSPPALGCVKKSTTLSQLNRFQIRISQSHVEVWGSDAGTTTLRQLTAIDTQIPLSRGLIWMEDSHYNGDKFNTQGTHAFAWDNVGFDGPILPRDLGFDILDATHGGTSSGNLGWVVGTSPKTFQFTNVHGVENASAALLEFTWVPYSTASITYSFNGHQAHSQPFPYPPDDAYFSSQTLAVPVPLNELIDGTNTLTLVSSDTELGGSIFANFDLILAGAGGIPGSSTPSPTSTPTNTAAPTSSPTSTAVPTDTTVPTQTPIPPTQTPQPTLVPTDTPVVTPTVPPCQAQVSINGGPVQLVPEPNSFCGLSN